MRKFIAVAALVLLAGLLGFSAGQPAPGPHSPMEAWTACVVHALTTSGMGTDADMVRCDDRLRATVGDDTLTPWLWCPGAPEQGGCRGRLDPFPVRALTIPV